MGVQRANLLLVLLLPDILFVGGGSHMVESLKFTCGCKMGLTLEQVFAVLALKGSLKVSFQLILVQIHLLSVKSVTIVMRLQV